MNNNPIKYGIIIGVIVLIFSGVYLLLKKLTEDEALG